MLHQLKLEMEGARLQAHQGLLACYKSKGNDFLYSTGECQLGASLRPGIENPVT